MELLSSLPLNVEDHCLVPNWTTMISKLNNSYCTAGLSQIPSSRPEGQRSNQSLQINEPRNSPLSSARMKKQMNQMTFRVNHESEPKFSPKSRRNRVFPPVRLNWSELVVDNGPNWSELVAHLFLCGRSKAVIASRFHLIFIFRYRGKYTHTHHIKNSQIHRQKLEKENFKN